MITAKEAIEATNCARKTNEEEIKKKLETAIKEATLLGFFTCSVVGLTGVEVNTAVCLLKDTGYQCLAVEDMRDHDWSVKISW